MARGNERQIRHANAVAAAIRRSAARRQCEVCGRKAATTRTLLVEERLTITRCRFCGAERCVPFGTMSDAASSQEA